MPDRNLLGLIKQLQKYNDDIMRYRHSYKSHLLIDTILTSTSHLIAMSTIPSQQKALVLDKQQGNFVLGQNKVYTPGPEQLLLKVKATALNPVDWKIQKYGIYVDKYPAVLGSDVAGDVVAVGDGVTKFKVGDRVLAQGAYTNDYATFQEFTLADEYHLAKVPSNISYEQAASVPLCLTTAFAAMYNSSPHGAALLNPIEASGQGHYKDEPFVLLGGASSVGQFVIQLARLSGFSPIIATASLKHTTYLQSLGATHVLDRNLSTDELKSQIATITNNKPIKYVYDTISLSDTQQTGSDILAPGGYLMLVLAPTVTPADKTIARVVAFRKMEQNVELAKGLYTKLTEWLESGVIQPNKVDLLPGGLAGIVEGLRKMENNQVSGVKLVVRPEETPAEVNIPMLTYGVPIISALSSPHKYLIRVLEPQIRPSTYLPRGIKPSLGSLPICLFIASMFLRVIIIASQKSDKPDGTASTEDKALLLESRYGNLVLGESKVYQPGPGQLLLKVKATALNPAEWKIQKYGVFVEQFPGVLGSDLAGDVVAVGEGVTKFKIGDRVLCQGQWINEYATFQEFTLADEYHLAKIPSNISYEQAASIPLGLATAFIAMYNSSPFGASLVNPVEASGQGHYKDEPFVVFGGSSSVGQFVIQLAKLSGFSPIIATASLKHTPFLKSLGATHVLDRNLPTDSLKAQIDIITNKPVKYVYDAISSPETQQAGNDILVPGGNLMLVNMPSVTPEDKTVTRVLAFRELEQNVELVKGLYTRMTEWIESGIIQPNRVELLPGGLSGIVEGLQRLENNQVSGVKLVARPEETPAEAK
ncbi:hypothetical protein D9756_003554 [Leucocoprinus leucothites]|uniref:Enoyl reductase (ER) domain-containing protein n=1 Tax=Leucocoprinus leucothites TaxID=201217 RepID=A0A8H5G6X5_9AGAR|nr:hypothetical protein D9756_003554 [Leucoagaricus leucothites]